MTRDEDFALDGRKNNTATETNTDAVYSIPSADEPLAFNPFYSGGAAGGDPQLAANPFYHPLGASTHAHASADIVTCSQSFHWMEPEPTLAEIARILRPGGVFAAYDYDWPQKARD